MIPYDPAETSYAPPLMSPNSEPTLWGQIKSAMPEMDPKRKKIMDAMLMRMAQPHYQPMPSIPPSDPFRYSPQ